MRILEAVLPNSPSVSRSREAGSSLVCPFVFAHSLQENVRIFTKLRHGSHTLPGSGAHTFRDDPDRVLVLIDLSNAFHGVSRGAVLSAVRTHFPWLAPLADTCYRHDSNLLIGSSLISSQRGVQQGDPLGPSLFALALHPCVTEAALVAESRFSGELDCNSFFLHDGVIAGRSPALATLEERLLEIGLCIARHKTEVVPACTSAQIFSPHDFEGFAWVPDGNIKLLPPLQADGLSQGDQDIRHSRGRLVGSHRSDDDWRVASIGVANGGLVARSALGHAPAAYISSLAQTQELCTRIWPGFDECDLDGGLMRSEVESSLGLLFFLTQEFTTLLALHPRKVCLPKLRPRFVITCLILRLTIAIGSLTSASIVSLGPVRGFLPFLIPPNPASRSLCFGSAYVVVS